ncbi:hypothetical protein [Vibrio gazogenes]|uniref:SD-repeat containing protein B domain-containing protein n=1 Tax=Vibrio gazogenes TaxID=687 RepID=A0A1Z2SJZ4_VIBGA|nr:hypothetical protein [Vibrio gazogenes]ASA57508.1 hypothetical protein BSQ33_17280 [Vibrio gazogenes]
MNKVKLTVFLAAFIPALSFAHTPLCSCYDMGDGTVLCEGGFSDGSSAAGVKMSVLDANGAELISSKMSEDGEFEFEKPSGQYSVLFNAGPGHKIEVDSKDIVE